MVLSKFPIQHTLQPDDTGPAAEAAGAGDDIRQTVFDVVDWPGKVAVRDPHLNALVDQVP